MKQMQLKFEKGVPNTLLGGDITPLEDASVPVEVLFNENSTCGEVMPLADVTVNYISGKDGQAKSYEYKKGENVIVAMEDLSELEPKQPVSAMDRLNQMMAGQDEYDIEHGNDGLSL